MIRLLIVSLLLSLLSACSAARVLVKDCHDAGPDLQNCEMVKKI